MTPHPEVIAEANRQTGKFGITLIILGVAAALLMYVILEII